MMRNKDDVAASAAVVGLVIIVVQRVTVHVEDC